MFETFEKWYPVPIIGTNYSGAGYRANHASILSTFAINCDGLDAIPCDASGMRINAVSTFLIFNAW